MITKILFTIMFRLMKKTLLIIFIKIKVFIKLLKYNFINLYISVPYMIHLLTYLKYSSVTNLNKLVDIIVIDNISKINRFEIQYIFWNIIYEYRVGIKTWMVGRISKTFIFIIDDNDDSLRSFGLKDGQWCKIKPLN